MAVSDSRGGVYARKGLNIEKLIVHKKQTRTVVEFLQATKKITNQQIWEQLVDMVAPAALENQITVTNAGRIKAKTVLEFAHGPVAPDDDEKLFKKDEIVPPDILVNSGG